VSRRAERNAAGNGLVKLKLEWNQRLERCHLGCRGAKAAAKRRCRRATADGC